MPAPDRFANARQELWSSNTLGFAITPSDTADLPQMTKEMFFPTAGNVRVTWAGMADGTSVIEPVLAGERLAWRISRVWASDTTVANIRGFV